MRRMVVWLLLAGPLLAQDPVDVTGWINRGVAEFRAAQYPQAALSFQRAVQSDPSEVTARVYLATAYMQQYIPGAQSENRGFADAATREFLKVLELSPGNQLAMESLGSLALNQKKWDEAQSWFEKVVAAYPDDVNAWYSLGFIAWSKWYPPYMQARASLGLSPADPGPLPPSAVKEELKTRYAEVIEGGLRALHQGLLINPKFDDAMAYTNLLIRERADLRDNQADYQKDVAEANTWVDQAMQVKKQRAAQTPLPGMAAPPPPPPPPGQAESTPSRIRIVGNVQAAQLLKQVPPVYPPLAKLANVTGPVELSIVIGRDGAVKEVSLLKGPALLIQAAMDAVRQWVYRPTMLNGEPVEVVSSVTVNFPLDQ